MDDILKKTQWFNKNVAFLGDSITDKEHVGTTKNYWEYLKELMGLNYFIYGICGHRWCSILEQAQQLKREHPDDMDAIFIFVGTNDFNGNVIPGEWWQMSTESANKNGVEMIRPRRIFSQDRNTVCGCINTAMSYLKENFPTQQIVMMTPIHRAYANFDETNVQPDETFPNTLGLYLESYIELIRQAADIWSVPLIDLYRESGLFPLAASHQRYFHDKETDLLHPSAEGHLRIARTMAYKMLGMAANFK